LPCSTRIVCIAGGEHGMAHDRPDDVAGPIRAHLSIREP
jgi:hypothetical protein